MMKKCRTVWIKGTIKSYKGKYKTKSRRPVRKKVNQVKFNFIYRAQRHKSQSASGGFTICTVCDPPTHTNKEKHLPKPFNKERIGSLYHNGQTCNRCVFRTDQQNHNIYKLWSQITDRL